jgi:Glyoxalase-like domain
MKFQVTFDAAEPEKLGGFWALALGYVQDPIPPEFETVADFLRSIGVPEDKLDDMWALVDPSGQGPRLFFQRVPEGKTAKNRVHLDVRAAEGSVIGADRAAARDAHVARLVEAGGSIVTEPLAPDGWTVMRDPEGNEFCVS